MTGVSPRTPLRLTARRELPTVSVPAPTISVSPASANVIGGTTPRIVRARVILCFPTRAALAMIRSMQNDFSSGLNRRRFLKTLGGGIFVFFSYSMLPAQERRTPGGQTIPTDFNAFVRIAPDGRVSCLTGKIEMGQGIVTSLAQMLADHRAGGKHGKLDNLDTRESLFGC